ncbi:alpha/beta fold hydrolase [Pleurocapsales cyanobacterium LEGE 06147]|nr:alpha/beta fold hydrolase [Pleurocapsales cyanobacterium LEGE 06147]
MQQQRINVGGLSIRYFQAGTDGLPILLLHGTGESALDWAWVMPILARNYRVYAPDFPGSGESSKPIRDYSLDFYTHFAINFLNKIAVERAVVVGNSLGGLIALRVALFSWERVATLVLVDSTGLGRRVNPFLSSLTLPVYGEIAIAAAKMPLGATVRSRSRAPLLFAHPTKIPREWYTEQERLAQTPGFLEATLSSLRAQLSPLGQRAVMVDVFPKLQMPTLLMWGTNDLIFPKIQAENAVKHLQQGQLVLLPDCGHIPHLEHPERFSYALNEFLTRHC